jgi:hypothetical protein
MVGIFNPLSLNEVRAFRYPVFVTEIFKYLVNCIRVVVIGNGAHVAPRIHHLLVILHEYRWGAAYSERLDRRIDLEYVLIC